MKLVFFYFVCAVIAVLMYLYFHQELVLSKRAQHAYEQEEYEKAAGLYMNAIRKGDPHADRQLDFVDSLSRAGLLQRTRPELEELISMDHFDDSALFVMAGAFESIQDWSMAAIACDRIIQHGVPTDAVLLKRARIAGYAGDWNAAAMYLRQILGDQ
ncbi:MAG: hypothetical protein JXR23_02085 [Pontiellaceae bacterium]|nr:hypothetical protein [Pontiellaceae bacterium]